VTQTVSNAVDELHRQNPDEVSDHRVLVKPDGEREKFQRHTIPIANAFEEPTEEKFKWHFAADELYSYGQTL